MSHPDQSACRGCGRPILWGVTEEGKRIPLDPRPPVYEQINLAPGGTRIIRRQQMAFVSHFSTCSHADQFSASKKAVQ